MKLEIQQDAAKEVLREKFIAMNAHIKTQEKNFKHLNFTPQGTRKR